MAYIFLAYRSPPKLFLKTSVQSHKEKSLCCATCKRSLLVLAVGGRGRVKPISILKSSEVELDGKLKKLKCVLKKKTDNKNEMRMTSTQKEHMQSYKGLAEENINELGSEKETCEAEFCIFSICKKITVCNVHTCVGALASAYRTHLSIK